MMVMIRLLLGVISLSPFLAWASSKDVLPIRSGIYVVNGTPCDKYPASANLMGYYGTYIAFGHDSCNFKSVYRRQRQVRALLECSNHQGADQTTNTLSSIFTVVDSENLVIGTQLNGPKSKFNHQLYTWCRESL